LPAQAIDLTVLAALEKAVVTAGKYDQPALAADKELVNRRIWANRSDRL
jgi:hypothetical protein